MAERFMRWTETFGISSLAYGIMTHRASASPYTTLSASARAQK